MPLSDCIGTELASPFSTLHGLPHYDSSAMDGWAVSGSAPWILLNSAVEERLFPGQAVRIKTGSLMPPGAESVLRAESGQEGRDDEGLPILERAEHALPGEPRRGQHIRKQGEEAAPGTVLIESGVQLGPIHCALAAVAGANELSVYPRPRVRLIRTGDELVAQGTPEPGQVRDAFAVSLPHILRRLGADLTSDVAIGDDRALLSAELQGEAELLITTGGTGFSRSDHLRAALTDAGAEILVDGLAVRPGAPAVLARLPLGTLVVGLPGNPFAAFVALTLLVEPVLRSLRGLELPAETVLPSGIAYEPYAGPPRAIPYKDVLGMAAPRNHTGANMLRGLADADGLLFPPPHGTDFGETTPVLALPWLRPQP